MCACFPESYTIEPYIEDESCTRSQIAFPYHDVLIVFFPVKYRIIIASCAHIDAHRAGVKWKGSLSLLRAERCPDGRSSRAWDNKDNCGPAHHDHLVPDSYSTRGRKNKGYLFG